jgi:hypothetical protein
MVINTFDYHLDILAFNINEIKEFGRTVGLIFYDPNIKIHFTFVAFNKQKQ